MFGITAYHIRLLVDNPMMFAKDSAGCGVSLKDVADMTPDQIYFRLCDRNRLRKLAKIKTPGEAMSPQRAYRFVNEQGLLKGRDRQGKVIELPMLKDGKTKVQLIRERLAAEKAKQSNGT